MSTVLAFARWFLQFLDKQNPTQLACFFDESLETGFRHQIDAGYKANRALPDESLAYELLACKKVCELLGVKCFASSQYEADDLIAAAAKAAYTSDLEPFIITRDKDLGQLLERHKGYFWDYGYEDPSSYDRFTETFGIEPKHIADFLAIAGDAADSIEGIKGIGKKTVAALFQHFDGWQHLKENLDELPSMSLRGAARVAEKLRESSAKVDHNLRLTRLAFDSIDPEALDFSRSAPKPTDLVSLFTEFNAPQSIINKI